MATFSKEFLSTSANGLPIQIAATATAGTAVHVAHATATDELWLWATNTSILPVVLTFEFGGTGVGNEIHVTVGANDAMLVITGIPITNSVTVAAYAATTNVVNVYGYVNRITA